MRGRTILAAKQLLKELDQIILEYHKIRQRLRDNEEIDLEKLRKLENRKDAILKKIDNQTAAS